MGVVYKLKSEIVDYIIEQKRNNSDISCRRLVAAIAEKFQLQVSKSSINEVIKEASLSSPVGRRAKQEKKTQKFKIPDERKAQLFPQLPQIQPAFPIDKIPEETKPQTTSVSEFKKESKPVTEKTPAAPTDEKEPFPAAEKEEPAPPVEEPSQAVEKEEAVPPVEEPSQVLDQEKTAPPAEEPSAAAEIEEAAPPVEELPQAAEIEEAATPIQEPPPAPPESPPPSIQELPPVPSESLASSKEEFAPLLEHPAAAPEKKAESENFTDKKILAYEAKILSPTQKPAGESVTAPEAVNDNPSQAPSARISLDKSVLCDGAGCFFLKAAEWELSSSPILGGLLAKYSNAYPMQDFTLASEVLLYLPAFGIDSLEGLKQYEMNGLWEINGANRKLGFDILSKLANSISNTKGFATALCNEYTQLFSEISYIRITLVDNTEICLDAQQKSIFLENNVHSGFSLPLNKTLSVLSRNIILNIQPLIIFTSPGSKQFSRQFYELLLAFENIPEKKIVKIAIFDGNKDEIARFSTIPFKKRLFVIGAWPWQEECNKFIQDDTRLVNHFYHENLRKEVFYSILNTSVPQHIVGRNLKIRVALIRENESDRPNLAILTNILYDEMSIQDIISSYLSKWCNMKDGYEDFSSKHGGDLYASTPFVPLPNQAASLEGDGYLNVEEAQNLLENIKFLLSTVNSYCQRHFFPTAYERIPFLAMRARFYSLSGSIQRDPRRTLVIFNIPEDYPHRRDLEYAIRQVNESDIKSPSGAQLILGL